MTRQLAFWAGLAAGAAGVALPASWFLPCLQAFGFTLWVWACLSFSEKLERRDDV